MLGGLRGSADAVRATLASASWSAAIEELLLDLVEHEAQHQAQLIRCVYGLRYEFQDSWKRRCVLG
ncbi:MAG: hypothetical protein FJZ92_09010 [Chloroflexi bacterium]|nr:hypothetical protein [Chloroflexota bacterium]